MSLYFLENFAVDSVSGVKSKDPNVDWDLLSFGNTVCYFVLKGFPLIRLYLFFFLWEVKIFL